jgi:ABC-type antimicrobial peptide transport system permease subunit
VLLFIQFGILLLFLSAFLIVALQMDKYKTGVFNHLSDEAKKHIVFALCYGEEGLIANKDAIVKEISESHLVKDVVAGEELVVSGGGWTTLHEGSEFGIPDYYEASIGRKPVPYGFFRFFECELLAGQFFTENSSPNDVVVDETFASYYKDKNPVGESFIGKKIVGVIKNLNTYKDTDDFKKKRYPVFYYLEEKMKGRNVFYIYVKAHTGKLKEVRQVLEKTIKKFASPSFIVTTGTLKDEISQELQDEKSLFKSMQILFAVSLIICLLGIYSAVVMNTEKRRKEIAIRKINGATIKDIILLFSKTYLGLWSIACLVFFPVVYYFGNKWLEKYIDRISLNIMLFGVIYLAILILIMLTIIFQILKVARCNPADVIKKE